MNTPQVFTYSNNWKITASVFGIGACIGACFCFYQAYNGHNIQAMVGFGSVISIMGVLIMLNAIRKKITVTDQDITERGIFGQTTLEFKNAKGYRTDKNSMIIEAADGPYKSIFINDFSYLDTLNKLSGLIHSKLHNIEQQRYKESLKRVMADETIGTTVTEREAMLKKAKTLSSWVNNIGIFISFWLLLYPHPYTAALITALVYPAVVIFVFIKNKAVIHLADDEKSSANPGLQTGLFGPAAVLLMRALLDYELLHFKDPLIPYVVAVVLILALFTLLLGWETLSNKKEGTWVIVLAFALLYGYGATVCVNCNFDHPHNSKHIPVRVTDMHYSSGKHTTYYLTVTPWGDRKTNEDLTIDKVLYHSVKIGDTVTVYQKPGLLHIPWYFVDKN